MMTSDLGYLKLADFGFTRKLLISDRAYTLCGTPEYLAPEIILGKGYNRGVDFWALGVMLYELIAGHTYFGRDTKEPHEIFKIIIHTKIKFPADFP